MTEYLKELKQLREIQVKRFEEIKDCDYRVLKVKRRSSGKKYYSAKGKGENSYRYLGCEDSNLVKTVKECVYLEKSIPLIEENISCMERALSRMKRTDYDSINLSLPQVYRGADAASLTWKAPAAIRWKEAAEKKKARYRVFKPEELVIGTDDGNYVRSKSEAMIYNELLSKGVTFVYELPLEIEGKVIFPDFTILSEMDFRTIIIIEHQGMMGNEHYRNRFFEKFHLYWRNGYVQGVNIFFTFDSADGGFDKTPFKDIIRTRIKPGL